MGNKPLGQLIAALALIVVAALPGRSLAQSKLLEPAIQGRQAIADSSEISHHARDLQAGFERRRRRMLPRLYTGSPDRCLTIGRFCSWDAHLEDSDVPDEGNNIRRARAELLRDLETAGNAVPGDDWIIGQRIRYLAEVHDSSTIVVARSCKATRWWCDALLGFALHVNGGFAAADSAFSAALAEMPAPTRCDWLNLTPLLDDELRDTYEKLPCAEREDANARIWWISDPLYMTPGNERRTEHYSRLVHSALQHDAANTYGLNWGDDLAELVLRFGWAEKWTQQPPVSMGSATQPSITGHEREPGFHFFLKHRTPDSLAQVVDSLFDIWQPRAQEQYAPAYARSFRQLDAQVARFRRGDSTRVVAAYDVSADTIFDRHEFMAALVAMGDDATPPSMSAVAKSPAKNVITVSTPWKSQLIGVELLAKDSAGAARWRSGFAEIPRNSGNVSVSDLLFVDGAPSLPADLDEAIPRAHGGTKFRRDKQVGLFWELYGKAPVDSALPVSLTITPINEGFFRRAFRALRIVPKVAPLNIRWQENGAAGLLSARSVLLDLSLVPAGKYAVKLEVGNYPAAVASRIIEVE